MLSSPEPEPRDVSFFVGADAEAPIPHAVLGAIPNYWDAASGWGGHAGWPKHHQKDTGHHSVLIQDLMVKS